MDAINYLSMSLVTTHLILLWVIWKCQWTTYDNNGAQICKWPDACPTNVISVEFEIRSKHGAL